MLLIDNRKGEYRMILRCDNCGREITNAAEANILFREPLDAEGLFTLGEHPLIGIYCKESCVHMTMGERLNDDCWQIHHVIHMLKQTMNFQAAEAADCFYLMNTGKMPKRMYLKMPKRPKTP